MGSVAADIMVRYDHEKHRATVGTIAATHVESDSVIDAMLADVRPS